jgi:hypothetical protein
MSLKTSEDLPLDGIGLFDCFEVYPGTPTERNFYSQNFIDLVCVPCTTAKTTRIYMEQKPFFLGMSSFSLLIPAAFLFTFIPLFLLPYINPYFLAEEDTVTVLLMVTALFHLMFSGLLVILYKKVQLKYQMTKSTGIESCLHAFLACTVCCASLRLYRFSRQKNIQCLATPKQMTIL